MQMRWLKCPEWTALPNLYCLSPPHTLPSHPLVSCVQPYRLRKALPRGVGAVLPHPLAAQMVTEGAPPDLEEGGDMERKVTLDERGVGLGIPHLRYSVGGPNRIIGEMETNQQSFAPRLG